MASNQEFIDFVADQIDYDGELVFKKMFGEFAAWADGKFFSILAENKFYIKPTNAGRTFIGSPVEAPPYPGAKNYFLIEDKLDDREWLSELVLLTVEELPEPKPKKKKK